MNRILLTGATGFLGSKVLARLLVHPEKYEVTVLKRSFSDTWRIADLLTGVRYFDLDMIRIREVFVGRRYDTILHCATDYGRKAVPRSDVIESNLLLPLRLLEAGLDHGLRAFISTDTMLDKNVSDYTLSKRQFRDWLRCLTENITGINMILEHFYGPGDDESKFVTHIVRALLQEKAALRLTMGAQKRDFVFVDDVVDAFFHVLDTTDGPPKGYLEFEVGSGRSVTVKEMVSLAAAICRNDLTHLDFGAIPYRSNEPMDVHVDVSRLLSLGWRPCCELAEGLRRTVEFERARLA